MGSLRSRSLSEMHKFVIYMIRVYQRFLSPIFGRSCCRFDPTCSQYSIEVISRFGLTKGLYLTIKRLLKCHPFYPGRHDPVPKK
jgi:hypothetical protein